MIVQILKYLGYVEMYRGIAGNRGITVSIEDAFLYALEQIQNADDKLKRDS